jgi:hypothetical protein
MEAGAQACEALSLGVRSEETLSNPKPNTGTISIQIDCLPGRLHKVSSILSQHVNACQRRAAVGCRVFVRSALSAW